MPRLHRMPARPRARTHRPVYPRLLGVGLLLTAAACGGTVVESEGSGDGTGGTSAQGGYGGASPAGIGGAPYEPDADTGGTGGMNPTGTGGSPYVPDASAGGTGGTDPGPGGSAGGGMPDPYEDAGWGGSAGEGGGAGSAGSAGAAGEGGAAMGGVPMSPFESGDD